MKKFRIKEVRRDGHVYYILDKRICLIWFTIREDGWFTPPLVFANKTQARKFGAQSGRKSMIVVEKF